MRKVPNRASLVHRLGLAEGAGTNSQNLTFLRREVALCPTVPTSYI